MNNASCLKFFLLSILLTSCQPLGDQTTESNPFREIVIKYPETFRDTTVVDNYFGLDVQDPYRWLEDANATPTKNWVDAQRSISSQYFEAIPFRNAIKKRLSEIWNHERYTPPILKGGKKYLQKNDGLQDQELLYELMEKEGKMTFKEILNPNTFSTDNTSSLSSFKFSPDGSLLAYQLSEAGSDWKTIYIQDMENNTQMQERIRWVKFSEISWFKDGFFYSRYPQPTEEEALSGSNQFHQVYYHRVGTAQEQDELIFTDRRQPQLIFSPKVSEDERYLFLSSMKSSKGNALYFKNLSSGDIDFEPVIENFDHSLEIIGTNGNNFLVLTNYKANRKRVVSINASRPDERYWEEIIPEADDLLKEVHFFNNKLVAHYLHNVSSQIKVYSIKGELEGEADLPGLGSVLEFSGEAGTSECFFSFTSVTQPASIYKLDLNELKVSEYLVPQIDFDGNLYETKQVWYESYDGTRIPMFVIHKKGLKLNGENPTLLYGYGGFNSSQLPIFNRTRLNLFAIFLENNGVCAIANLRGGGEFGSEWHESGTVLKKQNTFDDFQSAAEYLIANQYTSSEKLAIYGRSNGGLLVGACLTQRPDLYKVAVPAVGVLDMLRYHQFTIGWAWADDYGASEVENQFDYLYSYSPIHNISDSQYPATLITTGDHDDRVVPAHSYKFAATLQARQEGTAPVLLRVSQKTGNGSGAPVSKLIEEGADVLAFIFNNMKQEIVYDWSNN